MDLLREEILEKQRSLVIVTHDARIFEYPDRIVKLKGGRIIENNIRD